MNNTLITFFFLSVFFLSCSDDNNPSPNNNNNGGGGGNNSGCSGGPSTVTDIDGNTYNVVTIGNQCWMRENLKVSRYRNGDLIATNLNDSAWSKANFGAYAIYNNDTANDSVFGKIYNWFTVADPRGLCPTSWHVPSESEWNILVKTLDSQADTSFNVLTQSQIAGGLMKDTGNIQSGTGLWDYPNTGATNLSGFTGLPGGVRVPWFAAIGIVGHWWSSTKQATTSNASSHYIIYSDKTFKQSYYAKVHGFSVRCVRD